MRLPPPPPPPPTGDGSWALLANEWGSFTLDRTRIVRYGTGSTWEQRELAAGTGQCTNSFFGRDPAPGVIKRCEVWEPGGGPGGGGTAPMPSTFDSPAAMALRAAERGAPATVSSAAQGGGACASGTFPAAWTWDTAATVRTPPQPATSGTPRIRQYRSGQLIATYTNFGVPGCHQPENNHVAPDASCGAFSRGFGRNWDDGDVFEVDPAVYAGTEQQPYIGPAFSTHAQFNSGIPTVPKRLTIRGLTVNGQRPVIRLTSQGASNNTLGQGVVYIDRSENILFENIDVDGANLGGVGKAGIYVNGARDMVLRDLRVSRFRQAHANGIFGTNNNAGVLELDRLVLQGNGGDSGPEHNAYLNASSVDPGFTVWLHHSHSTDVYYGHTFKSRAQVNLIEGNYFQGTRAAAGTQAENYLVDIPEGGRTLIRNNIFVKNESGPNSNSASVAYAMEGVPDARPMSFVAEHNTFVAMAATNDGFHALYPFLTPYLARGETPPAAYSVLSNAYVGYCPSTDRMLGYRGDAAYVADFADMRLDYTFNAAPTTTHALDHRHGGVCTSGGAVGACGWFAGREGRSEELTRARAPPVIPDHGDKTPTARLDEAPAQKRRANEDPCASRLEVRSGDTSRTRH